MLIEVVSTKQKRKFKRPNPGRSQHLEQRGRGSVRSWDKTGKSRDRKATFIFQKRITGRNKSHFSNIFPMLLRIKEDSKLTSGFDNSKVT